MKAENSDAEMSFQNGSICIFDKETAECGVFFLSVDMAITLNRELGSWIMRKLCDVPGECDEYRKGVECTQVTHIKVISPGGESVSWPARNINQLPDGWFIEE